MWDTNGEEPPILIGVVPSVKIYYYLFYFEMEM